MYEFPVYTADDQDRWEQTHSFRSNNQSLKNLVQEKRKSPNRAQRTMRMIRGVLKQWSWPAFTATMIVAFLYFCVCWLLTIQS